ncbi:hypothetical protein DH2020_016035 [Rehmannia glutinosa]|uniref:BHLH domain-containing protein n=1 Tax=Rehmannia glutinosa TaxID=99300 RepID=A0ABR0WUC3_REHGL
MDVSTGKFSSALLFLILSIYYFMLVKSSNYDAQVMDNSMFMNQCDFIDTFDEDFSAVLFEQDFQNYLLSPRTNSTSSSTLINIPNNNSNNSFYTSPGMEQLNQQMPDNYSQFQNLNSTMIANPDQASSVPVILNFGNHSIPSENIQQVNPMVTNPEEPVIAPEVFRSQGLMSYNVNSEEAIPKMPKVQPTKKKARIRPPSQTYDHIIAERRRREQLSQLFVALSALVPGLKKMDKSSVLEDAIKYLKHLQDRVKTLEEKAEKQSMESVVLVKKSQIVFEDEGSSDEQSCSFDEQPLPEIEARVCENHILLRVHCEKEKGVLVKLLCKIESFNMIVVNTNATQFGNVALDITIIAELEKEFNLTVKEVVTGLREALVPAV